MQATEILSVLWAQGFTVSLADNGGLKVSPASTLHDTQRDLLRAHKAEIVELLASAHETTELLLTAAMWACDHYGDSEAMREEMRRDCLDTPPHLRANLLVHVSQTYGIKP